MTDPFGTAALRDSVLVSWRTSPTRLREDTNAEEDLVLGGYRDRLLTELAQNAADAATDTGGTLRVSLHTHEHGHELRVANTGGPLTPDGVAALASLRASAKQQGVGRFGVGFAAVLTVTDEPSIVSTTGGVRFSAARTRAELGTTDRVPVLRLVWPTDEPPPDGFATEVRLPLRDTVDPAQLLDDLRDQAVDLLLSLDGLTRIEIGDDTWHRDGTTIHGPHGTTRWVTVRDGGELPADLAATLGHEARPQWTIRWAFDLDHPPADDVLHAPTRTDERLSLPARLIATLPIEPSRRRVRPGPATDHVLAAAARAYPRLAEHVAPQVLIPRPGFPLSEVDEKLRQLVVAELRTATWLTAGGKPVAPVDAAVLPVPSAELAESIQDIVPGLLDAELALHATLLSTVDVRRLSIADVVDAVTGIRREPAWWHGLYDALAKIVDNDPSQRDELGALPVPLVDGRTMPGPRGTLLVDGLADLSTLEGVDVVHPDAAHQLLERLGAHRGGPADLLDSLVARVEHSIEDAESGMDVEPLTTTVLELVRAAGVRPGDKPWLGALALRDTVGEWRRADELALPGSTFLTLLADDAPLGVLAEPTAQAWPAEVLAAVGVLDSFALVVDEAPTGPDHDLADEADWWDEQPEPPTRLVAVRDLDLVADHAWPDALRLLASRPETWEALQDDYTAWWLADNALLAGAPPRHWRMPDAVELAGLYDPVPPVDVDPRVLEAIGVRTELSVTSVADAEDLLARLGDPERAVSPGAAQRTHAELAAAVVSGLLDPADLDPPELVRATTGEVTDNGVVLNEPWLVPVTENYVSAGPDFALAEPLAELLDLPMATDAAPDTVDGTGTAVRWADLGAVTEVCDLVDLDVPPGGPIVHDELTVAGARVPWWVDGERRLHCEDTTSGLARALAWATDRWADRHTLAALLEDPDNNLS